MEYIKKHPIRVSNGIIALLGIVSSYTSARFGFNIEQEVVLITGLINGALCVMGVSKGK